MGKNEKEYEIKARVVFIAVFVLVVIFHLGKGAISDGSSRSDVAGEKRWETNYGCSCDEFLHFPSIMCRRLSLCSNIFMVCFQPRRRVRQRVRQRR